MLVYSCMAQRPALETYHQEFRYYDRQWVVKLGTTNDKNMIVVVT